MIKPGLRTWVIKGNSYTRSGVNSREIIPFLSIAVKTGECQIFRAIVTTLCKWYNMINCETDILPALVGAAILA